MRLMLLADYAHMRTYREIALLLCAAAWVVPCASGNESDLADKADLLGAISRHDPIWEEPAETWSHGLLLGNGELGVSVWGEGSPLVLSLDKGDVWETRHWQPPKSFTWLNFRHILESGVVRSSDRSWREDWGRPRPGGTREMEPYATRVPIGRLELFTAGKPKHGSMRLRLVDAKAKGIINTDRGTIKWECFVAATEPMIILTLEATEEEATPLVCMRTYTGEDPISQPVHHMLRGVFGYPPPDFANDGVISYWSQSTPTGSEYAVAWREFSNGKNRKVICVTIASSRDKFGAKTEAIRRMSQLSESQIRKLTSEHDKWWADYYCASFLSIPDTKLEGLYWLEMYKLGSATRPGKEPISLVGVWAPDGHMPAWQGDYHWDVNVQMAYWCVYTANRLEMGMPLFDMLDRCRPRLRQYTKDVFGFEGEFLPVSTAIDCIPHYSSQDFQFMFSSLPWAAHHYWMHWKYSQDREFLKSRAVPIMKAALQPYLHELREGSDSKLHLPLGASPEYRGDSGTYWGPDPTMDLAVLRFLLDSLVKADHILGINDFERPTWEDTLNRLAPFPEDRVDGLKVRADLSYEDSHRHFSHLTPIYPFHQVTPENDQTLVDKSIRRWILNGHGEWVGFSFPWAASIAAHVGRPSLARSFLLDYADRFASDNTLMFQGPVQGGDMTIWGWDGGSLTLEAGFGFADAVQNMLLQSYDGVIRVFPASPQAWQSACFWHLRAEGAFLISALRSQGKTIFVNIISEKGVPVRLRTDFGPGDIHVSDGAGAKVFRREGKDIVFDSTAGGEYWIWAGAKPEFSIRPLSAKSYEQHYFGTKKIPRW